MVLCFRKFIRLIEKLEEREENAANQLLADFERLGFHFKDEDNVFGVITSTALTGTKCLAASLVMGLKTASRSQRQLIRTGAASKTVIAGANATRRGFKLFTKVFIGVDIALLLADTVALIRGWAKENSLVERIETLLEAFR